MSLNCVPIPQIQEQSSTNEEMKEKRLTDRIPVMRPVELRSSDGCEFSALCTDVNLSGIGVDTEHLLKVGQRVELRITAKDGTPSRVPMMVIYRMNEHYGLSALASLQNVLELLPEQA